MCLSPALGEGRGREKGRGGEEGRGDNSHTWDHSQCTLSGVEGGKSHRSSNIPSAHTSQRRVTGAQTRQLTPQCSETKAKLIMSLHDIITSVHKHRQRGSEWGVSSDATLSNRKYTQCESQFNNKFNAMGNPFTSNERSHLLLPRYVFPPISTRQTVL